MFLSILKKTLGPFGAVIGIVIILLLARSRFPFLRIIPLWVLFLVLIAVLVVWLAVLLIKWIVENRRAKAIEDGILDQADAGVVQASPARRAEIEELKRNLAEALATLKKGPQGKKALYSLPWYMIIGPPAIGKTTAIVNSGLNFPSMTTAKRMRGAGGTRNCDWWFSTDAILLDTAGRYAESVDRSETETEWFAFLDLLKTHRKKGPLDGLILGYSIEDLLQKDETGLIDSARELRQRMDEILDRLGWTFPVYVLFTKCDLISGFADYFSSLSPMERQQVWGAVYSPEPEGDQRAADRFAHEFDSLLENLRNARTRRMSGISRSEDWGRVFMFPEEFANLKDKMVLFIETLFEANPYRKDLPVFRGTYFSSGKQLGKPFDLVVRKIQSMLGVGAKVEEAQEQKEKEDAYFVRDLFAKVLKVDRDLVRLTGETMRRRAKVALFISAGFLVLGLLACVWVSFSYGRLRTKMDRTRSVVVELRQQELTGNQVGELERLEKLRREITGSWNSFPLMVADDVRQAAQGVYVQAVTDRILVPLEREIASTLRNPALLDGGEVRRALRVELMLLMPEQEGAIGWDAKDLAKGLCAFGLEDIEERQRARQQLDDMAEEFLVLGRPFPVNRDHELRSGARRLAQTHTAEEFFRGIVSEASRAGTDQTLELIVPDQSILHSEEAVRAAFTRAGWQRSVLPQVLNVDETWAADNRLIDLAGGEPTEHPPSQQDLLDLYRDAYSDEWVEFLESIRMKSYRDCKKMEPDLRTLQKRGTSPLLKLIRKAADIASLETQIKVTLPGLENIEGIHSDMEPLEVLTESTEERPAPLEEYAERLAEVYRQVDACAADEEEAFQVDRGVLREGRHWLNDFVEQFGGSEIASALEALMSRPIDRSAEVMGQVAPTRLQQEWAGEVFGFLQDNLAGAYPFADSDDTADPNDVTDFFGPGGAMANFAVSLEESPATSYAGRKTRRALQTAAQIRQELNMSDNAFEARFTLQAQAVRSMGTATGDESERRIDQVVLTINGASLVDRLQGAGQDFTWKADDENLDCSLVLESSRHPREVAAIRFGGTVWGICQLFDQRTRIMGTNDAGRLVTWRFPEAEVEVEFLLTTRDRVEPFFIRGSAFRKFSLPARVNQ